MKDTARELKLFIVPSFASKLISRKYGLKDLTDFSKLKEVFSIYDMASIMTVNNFLLYKLPFWDKNVSLPSWKPTDSLIDQGCLNEEDGEFYTKNICPYLYSETFKNNALKKYLEPVDGGLDVCEAQSSLSSQNKELPFKIYTVNSSVYIIVEEGFGGFFKNNESWRDFLQRVLKSLYSLAALKEANEYVVYGQYLSSLFCSRK